MAELSATRATAEEGNGHHATTEVPGATEPMSTAAPAASHPRAVRVRLAAVSRLADEPLMGVGPPAGLAGDGGVRAHGHPVVDGEPAASVQGAAGEAVLLRIPLVRTIYSATKKVVETLTLPTRSSFKAVVSVDFPRPGMRVIGFITGMGGGEVGPRTCRVFVPTTPNPTSGFLFFVPDRRHSRVEGEVPITDLRGVSEIPPANRFLVYSLFPETNISIRLIDGKGGEFVAFSVGYSILNQQRHGRCRLAHASLRRWGSQDRRHLSGSQRTDRGRF